MAECLRSGEQPVGPLLLELQGQADLKSCRMLVGRLAGRLWLNGRVLNQATQDEAVGTGCLALTAWRNGQPVNGDQLGAESVAWRAMVASVSTAPARATVSFDQLTPEGLAGSALPLPGWYEERGDKASRLQFERTRAKRPNLLARRMEVIKARGGRGTRFQTVGKVHRACVLLLQGEKLDHAARLAGFKDTTQGGHGMRSGDGLARAVRRLGFRFQFDLRQRR